MDAPLKLLADASLEVTAAEEALGAGAFHAATERLDAAAALVDALREAWRSMPSGERAIVGPGARTVRERHDAARARLPRLSALSVGTAVHDPEEDASPD